MIKRGNCVAEFVGDAIARQLNRSNAEATQIALDVEHRLAVRLARPTDGFTVTAKEAQRHLPDIIVSYSPTLRFLLLPFCEIPYGMYDSVLARLLEAGVTVGAGVASSSVFSVTTNDLHIVRVVRETGGGVLLVDRDFLNGTLTLEWSQFERAVLEADSGYWVVGQNGTWRTRWI